MHPQGEILPFLNDNISRDTNNRRESMKLIHGREVMQMIATSEKIFTKESLINEIMSRFGEDTRFFNCSSPEMTVDEIIAFFEGRGKFSFIDDVLVPNTYPGCNH